MALGLVCLQRNSLNIGDSLETNNARGGDGLKGMIYCQDTQRVTSRDIEYMDDEALDDMLDTP